MEPPRPSYPEVIRALCHGVVTDLTQRVVGPSTHYRCKATYSLYPPPLKTSALARQEVNDLCQAVADFASASEGADFYKRHPAFLFEVCGKVTRRCECAVKIVFRNDVDTEDGATSTVFSRWYERTDEPQRLFLFLASRCPRLVCVVAHVRLEGARLSLKPDKSCAYLPITATVAGRPEAPLCVTEYTPNGHPFLLSADSFCEVNQPMEAAIAEAVVECLALEMGAEGGSRAAPTRRRAFISGRDVNSVVKTFESYYESVTVATTCPSVFADTALNHISNVHLVSKDAVGELLMHAFGEQHPSRACAGQEEDGSAFSQSHVLVTAGRHGLHPSTSAALARLGDMSEERPLHRGLTDVVYVSCNVESFARDLFILKQSLRVRHVRTFDFFPGTDYVMTVVHLQPIGVVVGAKNGGGLLLLPVGPPGAGKSTSGRALEGFFCRQETAQQRTDPRPPSGQGRLGKAPADGPPKSSVPRVFAELGANVRVTVFERDRVFHRHREEGKALKPAKALAHADLQATLSMAHGVNVSTCGEDERRRWLGSGETSAAEAYRARVGSSILRHVVFLDSTNGSSEARLLYKSLWLQSRSPVSPSVTLWFDCPPSSSGALLTRVSQRRGHPCFPDEAEAQAAKVTLIQRALEAPSPQEESETTIVHVDATTTEDATVLQVIVVCAAFLHFSEPLASLYAPLALRFLQEKPMAAAV